MSPKANFLFFLNAYNDLCQTTTPYQNNFKWTREINGVPYNVENSQQIQVPATSTSSNLIPYPFSTPVNSSNGTLNSTTTVTMTGSITGITTGNLVVGGGIPVGTIVDAFVPSTVFTVASANATAGATYTNNGQTFTVSSTIAAGTALTTIGTGAPIASGTLTKASGTGDATITFSSFVGPTVTLSQAATTSGTSALSFYNPASFIYMESDQQISMIYNNGSPMVIQPFEINGATIPGVFFLNGPVYSLTVNNPNSVLANVFFASMG